MIYPARYSDISTYSLTLTQDQQWDVNHFGTIWTKNQDSYNSVAQATNVTPQLIAALHMRECDCNFTKYLLQGDSLGTVTWADGDSNNGQSLDPKTEGTVYFSQNQWVEAAIFALNAELPKQTELAITRHTTHLPTLCAFAEMYNGQGYYNRNVPSPYVLAGTSGYTSGKFVGDHNYDSEAVDKQVGVLPLLWTAFKLSDPIKATY